MTARPPRMYILYDARACANAGTADARVLSTSRSEQEAEHTATHIFGSMCACYSYAIHENPDSLDDERWEWDYES